MLASVKVATCSTQRGGYPPDSVPPEHFTFVLHVLLSLHIKVDEQMAFVALRRAPGCHRRAPAMASQRT
jgi:hypothetical protein